jgi:two-component system nitrogen regulation response regulator GlnG
LIGGESGTGKELLAQMIHRRGLTPEGPFVAVNCGTLPRELADSELFGHERGAFTGAGTRKAGWFEEAHGGTLVLDEIGELPLELQPKLLRVLETGRVRRVGGSGEVPVSVRVVATTWRDLRREAGNGGFRFDLYQRLAGFELVLPPLRRRRQDIPLLVERFLEELAREWGPRTLAFGALDQLMRYDWPGNVRELRNVLRRAAVLSTHQIDGDALDLRRGNCAEKDDLGRVSECEAIAGAAAVDLV